jgi:Na+-translocating ferredoxin:NAD+ oxidoreductase RnfG subunit
MPKPSDAQWLWLPVALAVAPACAADYLTPEQAAELLFPDAERQIMQLLELSKSERDRIKSLSGLRQRWKTQTAWRAERGDELLGWTIVDEVVGKHEYITYAAGISRDGQVVGIEILSFRETHGDEIRQASWREHFVGKSLDDAFELNEDIPNISGATLSCRNVTDGVKRLLALYRIVLAH